MQPGQAAQDGGGEGAALSCGPSAHAVAGNGHPLTWVSGGSGNGRPKPSADAVAGARCRGALGCRPRDGRVWQAGGRQNMLPLYSSFSHDAQRLSATDARLLPACPACPAPRWRVTGHPGVSQVPGRDRCVPRLLQSPQPFCTVVWAAPTVARASVHSAPSSQLLGWHRTPGLRGGARARCRS